MCPLQRQVFLQSDKGIRLMVEYDKVMPEYGFAGHKGYGSKEHIEAIKKYGSNTDT